MRLRGIRPRKFQMGGGAGGTSFAPGLTPQQRQMMVGAGVNPNASPGLPFGPAGAAAAAQANPLAQQLMARGAMPTPAVGAGPTTTLGAATPGGMMPPGAGGLPGAAGPAGMGNFQPRPGMGWGAAPGAGFMGVPPGGGAGMAGAGGAPGMPPGGLGLQQQALLGALAARGAGVPGAGMPGAAAPGLTGAGFARGGKVVARKGTTGAIRRTPENSFDSTKHVAGNLPIRSGRGKEPLARATGGGIGGRILRARDTPGTAPDRPVERSSSRIVPNRETPGTAPDRPVARSANRISPNVGTTGLIERGAVNRFDSTGSVGDNLPIRSGKQKEPLARARGGVVRRRPAATSAAVSAAVRNRNREDRRSPSPAPYYDTPAAGADGWPPTPNFSPEPGANAPAPGMSRGGKWIQSAIRRPGALRKQLGVPEGEKIPAKKLARAARAGGKLGQRARLAETLRGFHKRKGGACVEDTDRDGMRRGGVRVPPSRAAAAARREEERRAPDKMAAGGAAKQRRGFPNTIPPPPPKRMAAGGVMRGTGIAQRGTRFSGIY